MTDSNNPASETDQNNSEPEHTVGSLLKMARRDKGLSIEDIATALNLRIAIIEDIENDEFGNMASSTYVRGYIKNYARYVSADPFLINECVEKQLATPVSPSMQSFSNKTSMQAANSQWMWITYLIIAILVAMLCWWGIQKSTMFSGLVDLSKPSPEEKQELIKKQSTQIEPASTEIHVGSSAEPKTETVKDKAEKVDLQPQAVDPSSSHNIQEKTEKPSLLTEVESAADVPVSAISVEDHSDEPVKLTEINLTLTGDCWINIQDATGKVIVSGLKKSGRVIIAEGEAPLKAIFGAPESIQLKVDGVTVDMDRFPAGKTARMTLAENP
ncbi:helix-turn-helix domain-containing protein [Parashewanella curva]|uniref:Helix-turn-helix domain-containing protein n=1 Tax=Parashewanella curva TaxID=2338552 RepID=A0A3L8Q0N1_9GAMM|nr:RodZ family helix-turn-helix domain-containing protein [Parashewanella curva]RLV59932.1 helix-turn-helix domain-containing protein [Parashewanella curva]